MQTFVQAYSEGSCSDCLDAQHSMQPTLSSLAQQNIYRTIARHQAMQQSTEQYCCLDAGWAGSDVISVRAWAPAQSSDVGFGEPSTGPGNNLDPE